MKKYSFETACKALEAFPANDFTFSLTNLLHYELAHEGNLAELCVEAYKNGDRPHFLRHTLTEMATLGERRCLQFRNILGGLASQCADDSAVSSGAVIPFTAQGIDIGHNIECDYNPATNTFRMLLPELLPLKSKMAEFLPAKVQRAIRQFDNEYRHNGGETIRIFPAFCCFVHHYDEMRRYRNQLRDFDNLEWSAVLNALQSTRLFSDNAAELILMQMAVPDTVSCTEIIITDVKRMPELLQSLDYSLYERPADTKIV